MGAFPTQHHALRAMQKASLFGMISLAVTIEESGGVVHWLDVAGIRLRAAHWPDGPRGTVLLLSGRTDFIERYRESIAELQTRGYAVWMLDWRGQGASQRLLRNPIQNHVARFTDYLADLDHFLDHIVLPGLGGRRLLLMAHSMGGHLGAHLLAKRAHLFSGAVLLAPMIDFAQSKRFPRRLVWLLAQMICLRPGMVGQFGPGTSRRPMTERPFLNNALTSCPDRYAAAVAVMRANPELVVAGATWGWLRASLASSILLNRAATIRRIDIPVLVMLAGADRLVDNGAIRRFVRLLPRGELVEVAGARHELLNERDEHRLPVWAAIDRFFATVAC